MSPRWILIQSRPFQFQQVQFRARYFALPGSGKVNFNSNRCNSEERGSRKSEGQQRYFNSNRCNSETSARASCQGYHSISIPTGAIQSPARACAPPCTSPFQFQQVQFRAQHHPRLARGPPISIPTGAIQSPLLSLRDKAQQKFQFQQVQFRGGLPVAVLFFAHDFNSNRCNSEAVVGRPRHRHVDISIPTGAIQSEGSVNIHNRVYLHFNSNRCNSETLSEAARDGWEIISIPTGAIQSVGIGIGIGHAQRFQFQQVQFRVSCGRR